LNADPLAQFITLALRIEAEDLDLTVRGPAQSHEAFDSRRLAGAVRADHSEDLAAAHLERHSVDSADIPIAFAKLIDNNCVHEMKEVQ